MNAFATFAADTSSTVFWSTGFGTILKTLMMCMAIVIVVLAAVKSVGHFSKGKVADGVKVILGSVVVAVFLFRPEIIDSLINTVADLVDSLLGSSKDVITNPNGTGSGSGGSPVVNGG